MVISRAVTCGWLTGIMKIAINDTSRNWKVNNPFGPGTESNPGISSGVTFKNENGTENFILDACFSEWLPGNALAVNKLILNKNIRIINIFSRSNY